ncbi:MAG: TfoX/Sxy family protein [Alphaproteobacteria bacterium]|nr:TfoX/Sxy family protein [Alphaproteobacteria bacterium]
MSDHLRAVDAAVERLSALLGRVETKESLGAAGLLLQGTLFGMISDGKLYFRTDDQNRGEYEAHESDDDGFFPAGHVPGDIAWRAVPAPVQDDDETLRAWAKASWEAGKRAAKAAVR